MKAFKPVVIGLILAATVVMPLWTRHRAAAALHATNERLQQQASRLAQLRAENERLSNLVATAKSSGLSDVELSELLKLRNEVGQLKWTLKGMAQFRRELQRTRDGLEQLAREKERGRTRALALRTDELEMQTRRERVALVREWMQEKPEQETPELKLLTEADWLASMNWTHVTDEEFQGAMSSMRGRGEMKVGAMMRQAARQYAEANGGQFPTDLSLLKPYFQSPIDDAILQRYHVVPADSLNSKLSEKLGGEWVITQKAPVNPRDTRFAIGLTNMRGGSIKGRWDPPP